LLALKCCQQAYFLSRAKQCLQVTISWRMPLRPHKAAPKPEDLRAETAGEWS
jgi:hypothetical protein